MVWDTGGCPLTTLAPMGIVGKEAMKNHYLNLSPDATECPER